VARHASQARLIVVFSCVVLLGLVLAAVAVVQPGPVKGWLGASSAGQPSGPGQTSGPPPGPALIPAAGDAPMPTADGVRAAVDPLIKAANLGPRLHVSVVDVLTGDTLYARGPDTLTVPASTTKLVTAAAVLSARGPAYRMPTRVVAGARPGEVVLVGAGDATLAIDAGGSYPGAARLDDLAGQVRKALGGVAPTRVVVDSTLFTGPIYGPWDADIPRNGYAGPTMALMTDGARVNPKQVKPPAVRFDKPDIAAGQALARQLGLPQAAVAAVARSKAPAGAPAEPGSGAAPSSGAAQVPPGTELGRVDSMPIGRMVEIMLAESDNVLAESLARQVALAEGKPATYAGAAEAILAVVAELGLPVAEVQLADGSGFARKDKITPSFFTDLFRLAAAPNHPELHGIFGGLPVAGYSGTLAERYRSPAARSRAGAGFVRAKTGTLYQVNAISGIVLDADGRLLTFAMMADQVAIDQFRAQDALDRVAAALAGCGCR